MSPFLTSFLSAVFALVLNGLTSFVIRLYKKVFLRGVHYNYDKKELTSEIMITVHESNGGGLEYICFECSYERDEFIIDAPDINTYLPVRIKFKDINDLRNKIKHMVRESLKKESFKKQVKDKYREIINERKRRMNGE